MRRFPGRPHQQMKPGCSEQSCADPSLRVLRSDLALAICQCWGCKSQTPRRSSPALSERLSAQLPVASFSFVSRVFSISYCHQNSHSGPIWVGAVTDVVKAVTGLLPGQPRALLANVLSSMSSLITSIGSSHRPGLLRSGHNSAMRQHYKLYNPHHNH